MLAALISFGTFAGCQKVDQSPAKSLESGSGGGGETAASEGTGEIIIDGSSTVEPVSTRVAEAYRSVAPNVLVSVATSGTGGGFKRFIAGETDINNASRPIKEKEAEECKANNIEYVELKIAIDGLSVVVNQENDFCKALTVAQLKAIWEPESKVSRWNQVNPEWPDEKISLYGADTDSGTFDYFTEEICGESGACRTDYTASANDNDLVLGVTQDKFALGYFGYAYYLENRERLSAVAISPTDNPADAVEPNSENIESGRYTPLSRPLFIYVRNDSLKRPEVKAFVEYYLGEGSSAVTDAGYVQTTAEDKAKALAAVSGQ
ncbi:MAG: PstS family phosphate ABC transporter substrate-binding protein [Planctomycetaceae bacterium]